MLRAKIDMAHPNMIMRDPLLLRIRHAHHYRQGDAWCLYPLYDFAHPLSDAIEGITHSLCTLEFKDNNDIYRWLVHECGFERPPEQTEFARLELDYTVLSKRKLLRLVNEGFVSGWDDPRMPTIAGMRRRGVTPEALRDFCETIGVARKPARTELATFEHAVRNDLNMRVPRVMCVTNPLKVVIDELSGRSGRRARRVVLSARRAEDWIAPGAVFARALHRARRLHGGSAEEVLSPRAGTRGAAALRLLHHVYRGREGPVRRDHRIALHVRPGDARRRFPDGRKVQGTIHWVSASQALDCELRLYDKLFTIPDPDAVEEGQDFSARSTRNHSSSIRGAKVEPSVAVIRSARGTSSSARGTSSATRSTRGRGGLMFNRTVTLRDSWAKIKDK